MARTAPVTGIVPYCDDCGRKHGLPIDDPWGVRVVGFYGRCGRCGVIRVCYGPQDPAPQKPRRPRIPEAVQDWQRGRDYR